MTEKFIRDPRFRQGGIENSLEARQAQVVAMLNNRNLPDAERLRLQNELAGLLVGIDRLGPAHPYIEFQRNQQKQKNIFP